MKQQQACDRSQRTRHSKKPCSSGGTPLTSTDKDMIDLLRYPSGIAIPSPAVQHWSLIPGTRNSQPSGSFKIQKERAVVIPGTRTMGTNTYLIASPFGASDSIKVAQDNECITTGTLVQYRVEFGIEHPLLFSFTHLSRIVLYAHQPEQPLQQTAAAVCLVRYLWLPP